MKTLAITKAPKLPKKSYIFKNNNLNTLLVAFSFGLYIVLNVIDLILTTFTLRKFYILTLERTIEAKESFVTTASLYANTSIWTGLIYILCAIIFACWLVRASKNTHALNPNTKIEFSPGWCIGSYFIPILGLYWPYVSMRELWMLNVKSSAKGMILIWWLSFLLANFFGTIVSKFKVDEPSDMYWFVGFDSASLIFGIISAAIAIVMVKKINAAQVRL